MSISGLETIGSTDSLTLTSSRTTIDSDEFLTIFLAELENQDPTEPLDTVDYVNQLCSLSEVSQIEELNGKIDDLLTYESASIDENAISFVGKTVKYEDNSINLSSEESSEISFDLSDAANEVYVYIYDESGELVKEITESGEFIEGENTINWDGTDNNGDALSDGQYTFEIFAVDAAGTTVSATAIKSGEVASVKYGDGQAILVIDNREIELTDVIEVYN